MDNKFIVVTKNLTKRFDSDIAVNKLNLRVAGGEIFGLLGPDGAGKTTTLQMLLGLTAPSSGEASVCGHNPDSEPVQVRVKTGYLGENPGFYDNLTAKRNLKLNAEMNSLPHYEIEQAVTRVIEFAGLKDAADKKVRDFSPVMKHRLGIADALVKKPELVLLDEPIGELEEAEGDQITELITQLPGMGTSVIVASRQLFKMQNICDRVGIIHDGKLVGEGSSRDMGEQGKEGHFRIEIETKGAKPELAGRIGTINGVIGVEVRDNTFTVTARTDVRSEISRMITLSNLPLVQMKIIRFNLNEIYNKYFRDEEQ